LLVLAVAVAAVAAVVPGVGAQGRRVAVLPRVGVYASVPDPAFGTDVLNKLKATHQLPPIDSLGNDCHLAPTPSLATLLHYTSVFVYSDCAFNDRVALGNVLANYVDAGGHVVLATFALNSNGFGLAGRLVTGGYLPVTQGAQVSGTEMHLVADQPSSSLLSGVTTFDGGTSSYHALVSLAPGGHLVAHWSGDGSPLVASKGSATAGHVVALNFYPPSSDARPDFWLADTDGVRLMTNAILYGTLTHT
jgi:hypothetical protein